MAEVCKRLACVIGVVLAITTGVFAQRLNKAEVVKLFDDLTADEKAVAECDAARRKEQIKKFGKPLPRISGHCWSGCPVSLPLPYYPSDAKRLRVGGLVVVETVVNEEGNVVYAKAVKGSNLLRFAAVEAAYHSRYQPTITCNDRKIKFRWTIKYNFRPDEIRVFH